MTGYETADLMSEDGRNFKYAPCDYIINNACLAHAYVPYQTLGNISDPSVSLKRGTVFPELYMPYN